MTKPKIKLHGLSLFANVGIAEAYFKSIGVQIEVANEYVPERAKFYQHVYPDTLMIQGDITKEETMDKVIAESKARGVDFIIATPPCQNERCGFAP